MASKRFSISIISNLVLELTYFWKLVLETLSLEKQLLEKQVFIKEDLYQNVLTC